MANQDDWVEIRRATLADVQFIRQLCIESVVYGVPGGRDIANDEVQKRAAESLRNLEILVHRRKDCAILVAFDKTRDEHRAGYLILEFKHLEEATGEMQSHVFDMAVEQAYMGKYVGHRLVREAARVSHQQGYRYMSANISAANERALLSAIKLGFDVERFGLVMACDADGIARMPGRPKHERGLAVNRARRMMRRQKKAIVEHPGSSVAEESMS
ncbi:MAG: GNAT family N-acetyltransferase [Candidatus Xenobia bacterium]